MNKEDRNLLLKDLCGRLVYGVKCQSPNGRVFRLSQMNPHQQAFLGYGILFDFGRTYDCADVKPYLRPMNTMTDEENVEYQKTLRVIQDTERTLHWCDTLETFDWLNAHHFDYRGLIEKGLALEAPKGMYNDLKKL